MHDLFTLLATLLLMMLGLSMIVGGSAGARWFGTLVRPAAELVIRRLATSLAFLIIWSMLVSTCRPAACVQRWAQPASATPAPSPRRFTEEESPGPAPFHPFPRR